MNPLKAQEVEGLQVSRGEEHGRELVQVTCLSVCSHDSAADRLFVEVL